MVLFVELKLKSKQTKKKQFAKYMYIYPILHYLWNIADCDKNESIMCCFQEQCDHHSEPPVRHHHRRDRICDVNDRVLPEG